MHQSLDDLSRKKKMYLKITKRMLPFKNKMKRMKEKAFGILWSAVLQHRSGHFILINFFTVLTSASQALANESENQAMNSAWFVHYSQNGPE